MHCPESIRGCSRQPETTKCFELREQIVPRPHLLPSAFVLAQHRPRQPASPGSGNPEPRIRLYALKLMLLNPALCSVSPGGKNTGIQSLTMITNSSPPNLPNSALHSFSPSQPLSLKLAGESQVCSLWGGAPFSLSRHSTPQGVASSPFLTQSRNQCPGTITHRAQASAQMFSRERETVQQMSVSSKMLQGARLDSQVLSFPNQLITQRPQRGCG